MTKTKRILSVAGATLLCGLSFATPFVNASADGWLDGSLSEGYGAYDLCAVPFANWSVTSFDTFGSGNTAQIGGNLSVPNAVHSYNSQANVTLNLYATAGTLVRSQIFGNQGLPQAEGVKPLFNYLQYESYYPYGVDTYGNDTVAWKLELMDGGLENTLYYDNAMWGILSPFEMSVFFVLYDVEGKEHTYYQDYQAIPADYIIYNSLYSLNMFYAGRYIKDVIADVESRDKCVIEDNGIYAYNRMQFIYHTDTALPEHDVVTRLFYDSDNGYYTMGAMGVRKADYIKNHRPPIDNTDATMTIWTVAESFLTTEFLPNFTFGAVLLIGLGCAVLAIVLKFAFGG